MESMHNEEVTWVIPCMDDRKLRLILRYLPEEPFEWLKKIVVVVGDVRDLDIKCELVARHYRPEWPIKVRTEEREHRCLDSIDAPEALRVYFRDLLGVKLLLPLTIEPPFLYTDDDVILRNNPAEFLGDDLWASQSGLDAYTTGRKDQEALGALCDAFNTYVTVDEFNKARTDAGVWYFPDYYDDYDLRLWEYFGHSHVVDVSKDPGVANGNHTQRFRKLDQRFLSMWMRTHGGSVVRTPIYRAMADKKMPVRVPNNVCFIHYCASAHKERYMEWLTNALPNRR